MPLLDHVLLHDRAFVGICRRHVDCVYRQWFLEIFLVPFSNVNDIIMPMSDAVSSEVSKTIGIQKKRYLALSLTHRDLFSLLLTLLMIKKCIQLPV